VIRRRRTKRIHLGGLPIGGGAPIVVQSMTKTDTRDIAATVNQIHHLETAGCEAVRLAVVDMEAAEAIGAIRASVSIPIIADIHFDHRLALEAMAQGVDGLRINPGNIGDKSKVRKVVQAASRQGIAIRIGVNAGSLEKSILKKYGTSRPEALVESAEEHIRILEEMNFTDIKVSLKASDVHKTVEAYRLFSKRFRYPLHIGISEAGPAFTGTIKSSVGLGILLAQGIGDTLRVSLTADPVEEVRVAYEILQSLDIRRHGPDIVSCPTCGRCQIQLRGIASEVEARLRGMNNQIKVAVMGCVVNGPGEAKDADVGIAGGKGIGILFKKGKVVRKVPEKDLLNVLMQEIEKL